MNEIVLGTHAVETAVRAAAGRVKRLMVDAASRARLEGIIEEATKAGIKVAFVSRDVLNRQAPGKNHQGIIAELEPHQYASLSELLEKTEKGARVVLVLDGVTDPQNLGNILRSAGAFGAGFLVIPKDRAVPVTPVVAKIASGALEEVPVVMETNLVRALATLKEAGFWCYALEAGASRLISEIDLTGDVALILGSEGKGIRPSIKQAADEVCSIPASGPIPSLNVASAATCALYETFRQRAAAVKK